MQKKIKQLNAQLKTQTIENEKLAFKITEVTENVIDVTSYE